MELISEGFFGKYSKMKILDLTFLKKSNFEAFFRSSTLKTENVFKNVNGSICAYRIIYPTILKRVKGPDGTNFHIN